VKRELKWDRWDFAHQFANYDEPDVNVAFICKFKGWYHWEARYVRPGKEKAVEEVTGKCRTRLDAQKAATEAYFALRDKYAPVQNITLTRNADGTLDQLSAQNATVTLEQMSPGEWCLAIAAGEQRIVLSLHSEAAVQLTETEVEGVTPSCPD